MKQRKWISETALIKVEVGQKFTSRQVAEWTGKEHKNLLADIRDEIEKLKDGGLAYGFTFL